MALLLSCQSISKSFGAKPLFENISFGVSEGDSVGLIGPNGAGKSTLLRILAGLADPDEGIVAPRKLLRLGYVEQLWEAPGTATIQELVEFAPAARINEILGRAGLTDRGARVSSLSGGWTKRLSIAIALLKDPELLILDEPTNHLDLEATLWLESWLARFPGAALVVPEMVTVGSLVRTVGAPSSVMRGGTVSMVSCWVALPTFPAPSVVEASTG